MEKLFEEFSPKTLQEWNDKIITDLKGKDYQNLIWDSPEDIKVSPVYNSESLSELNGDTTHHHSDWEVEQSFSSPTNKELLDALNGGASSLLLKEVNKEAFENTLENVLIQHIQTSIEAPCLDTFIQLLDKRALDKNAIKGSLYYDPLMSALQQGSFETDLWTKFNAILEKASSLPSYKSLCIKGHEYHNAGASATQELAFTLAQLSEYLANNKDLNPNKIQLSLGVSTNYFFEIAKFRAIRILWEQILKAYKKESCSLELRAETGLRTSTVYDPHVNMLRTTSQCMSAALGGANIIHVNRFNAAYKPKDDFAERMARNISLILKEEAYFNKVSDPASGSYYIEQMTNELSQNAWKLFQEIEAQGGWTAAVKSNILQDMIAQYAQSQEEKLKDAETHLLGTNLYPNKEELMGSEIEISIENNCIEQKDFKTLYTRRLSTQMDVERLEQEKNA